MPVFRLDPVEEKTDSLHWRASTEKPQTVWVRAVDEEDAREQLTTATIIATRVVPGEGTPLAPWKDFGLVECFRDDSKAVPPGVILIEDGRTITVKEN